MSYGGLATSVRASGRRVAAFSSALRPAGLDELEAWGGAGVVRGKRVLDLGCGDGRLALAIAPYAASVQGLDPDPAAIAAARKAAKAAGVRNASFAVGSSQRLRYRDSAFDLAILSWSL